MPFPPHPLRFVAVVAIALVIAGCGDDAGDGPSGAAAVVASTSIVGDIVANLSGDLDLEVLIPAGADPHEFRPSARQVEAVREADLVVTSGAGFEEGLADVLSSAEADGARVIAAADALGADAEVHWFTDPLLTAEVVPPIADALVDAVPALDPAAVGRAAETYVAELEALHRDIESLLAEVPEGRRRLVTTHDVFGPFARRYDLEVVGTVVAGDSTGHAASAGALADLAAEIREAGVPAVFVEHGSDTGEAEALAGEAGVDVVELFTESLGPEGSGGATYLAMMRANAEAIAGALTP